MVRQFLQWTRNIKSGLLLLGAIGLLLTGCANLCSDCKGAPELPSHESPVPTYNPDTYSPSLYPSKDAHLALLQSYGAEIYPAEDDWILSIPSDILFKENSFYFQESATKLLNALAAYLSKFPEKDLFITAFTDSSTYDGKTLSTYQSLQLAGYLWANHIPNRDAGQRLFYEGKGKGHPIATNQPFEGMTKNRRIQIMVTPKGEVIPSSWVQISQKPSVCKNLNKPKKAHHPYKKAYSK